MIEIPFAYSELTKKTEVCTICPELRSEIDGKVIVDGTPDCDLLAMHEFGFCPKDGMLPASLIVDRNGHAKPGTVVLQASDKFCKKIARRLHVKVDENRETEIKIQTAKRIRENESEWNKVPTDDEVEQLIKDEPGFIIGLMRLLAKLEE